MGSGSTAQCGGLLLVNCGVYAAIALIELAAQGLHARAQRLHTVGKRLLTARHRRDFQRARIAARKLAREVFVYAYALLGRLVQRGVYYGILGLIERAADYIPIPYRRIGRQVFGIERLAFVAATIAAYVAIISLAHTICAASHYFTPIRDLTGSARAFSYEDRPALPAQDNTEY